METMNTIEKVDEKIRDYKVLADAAGFIKEAVRIKGITTETAVEQLADIVMMLLRSNVKRAEEAKEMLQSIKDGSHLAGI
jgi:hypothetical protein